MTRDQFKQSSQFKYKGKVFEYLKDDDMVILKNKEGDIRFRVVHDTLGFVIVKYYGGIRLTSDFMFYSECDNV
jgi:Fe-S cluster biogenesis protein NfuA